MFGIAGGGSFLPVESSRDAAEPIEPTDGPHRGSWRLLIMQQPRRGTACGLYGGGWEGCGTVYSCVRLRIDGRFVWSEFYNLIVVSMDWHPPSSVFTCRTLNDRWTNRVTDLHCKACFRFFSLGYD